jgi:hypothetical protein
MYEAWQPSFDRVYGHLFAAFLRPYRGLMMFPFEEYWGLREIESLIPKELADTYQETFNLWGERWLKLLELVAGSFRRFSGGSSEFTSNERQSADEEEPSYSKTLERFLGYFGESQFMKPEAFIVHLQNVASSYPQVHRLYQQYEALFRVTWEKSLKRFTIEIKKAAGSIPEFKEFSDMYMTIFSQEYDHLLRSPAYSEVQNGLIDMDLDMITSMKKAMEAQLEIFPASPFATDVEVNALGKRVHGYKRQLDKMERRMREIERKLIAVPQGDALERLEKKVEGKLQNQQNSAEAIK